MKLRLLSLLLALVLTLGLLSGVFVSASTEPALLPAVEELCGENAIQTPPEPLELPYLSGFEAPADTRSTTDDWNYEIDVFMTIEPKLIAAIRAGQTKLDVSSYKILSTKVNLSCLKYYSPYIGAGIDIVGWKYSDGYYSHIAISYTWSQSAISAYFTKVDAMIEEVDGLIAAVPSVMNKALYFHDYLACNCEYDYDNYLAGTIPAVSYRSCGIMMNQIGVCQGYSYAFMYFMNRAGIPCRVIISNSMNHSWNIFKLNGTYYHIDVTWDDPTPDNLGQVSHNYFLLSDTAIGSCRGNSSQPHYGWSMENTTCSSTTYDEAYWYGIDSPIVFSGDYRYFCTDEAIIKRDGSTGAQTKLVSLGTWPVWSGSGHWIGSFTGLWLDEDKLYYNSATEIRCVSLTTGADKAVYTPDTSSGYIYGSVLMGDVMYYELSQNPNVRGQRYAVSFCEVEDKERVVLSQSEATMAVGETLRLTATVYHGTSSVVSWSSSNPSMATVGSDGTVTALYHGTTTITAQSSGGATASCTLTVTPPACSGICGELTSWSVDLTTGVLTINGTGAVYDYPAPQETPWAYFSSLIKEVSVGSAVTSIGSYAFRGCTELKCIILPVAVKKISANAFADCVNLSNIYYIGDEVYWNRITIESGNEPLENADIHFYFVETPCADYTDVNRRGWYYSAANYVVSRGLMGSTRQDALTFEPDTKVSRAMVASILYRMAGNPEVSYAGTFTDVPEGKWFTNAIEWCAQNDLASGKGSGKFDPNGKVTRQELAVFMLKMAQHLGKDTSGRSAFNAYADAAKVPAWAKDYVSWAVSAGLISGKSSNGKTYLAPADNASRAELASILMRFVRNIGNG